MKKGVKIAILSAAVLAVAAGVVFVVIPLASSSEAEKRVREAFTEAGIPEDMWSIGKASYIPFLNNLVIDNLVFGERDSASYLEAKKVTLTIGTDSDDIFAGSVTARSLSLEADDSGLSAQSLSVNDFSVDKTLFGRSPLEAIKKLKSIHLSNAKLTRNNQSFISLGTMNAAIDYTEGKIPLSPSLSIKEMALDIRQLAPLPALRPEYRFSNIELKNSFANDTYTASLVIDSSDLFSIKSDFGASLPREILESGNLSGLAQIDYDEDLMFDSFSFVYTDKSFLGHVFELAGMDGGREAAAEELTETLQMLAMMSGIDTERFATEAAAFISKSGKFELKSDLSSPVSFRDISRNPFAMNLNWTLPQQVHKVKQHSLKHNR